MKRLYSDQEPENLAARDRVWLTKVPKRRDFTGISLTVPVKYGNPQSISTTLPGAQAGVNQNKGGAFLELLELEVNGTIAEHGRRLSNDLYGKGSGSLGKISSVTGATNGTITLVNPDDVKNFAVQQSIGANPTETGSSGTARVGTATITNRNEDAGTITFSGTITGIQAGDFLYNANATATDYDFGFMGLAAWIPLTAPSATLFMNVDRTADVNALAGWRLNR